MRSVDYVIRYVRDLDVSIAFYRDVLGLELKLRDAEYAEFVTEGCRFGLYDTARLKELIGMEASPGPSGNPEGEVLFLVDDVDGWAGRLRQAGVRILSGPVDRPWGHRTLHLRDPDGLVVELAQEIPREGPGSG